MLYRIQIDMRLDKMKAVTDAIKEAASDFVILQGRAYSSNKHKPCWIVEIEDESNYEIDFTSCIEKLKKVLNMSTIPIHRYPLYKAQV